MRKFCVVRNAEHDEAVSLLTNPGRTTSDSLRLLALLHSTGRDIQTSQSLLENSKFSRLYCKSRRQLSSIVVDSFSKLSYGRIVERLELLSMQQRTTLRHIRNIST